MKGKYTTKKKYNPSIFFIFARKINTKQYESIV